MPKWARYPLFLAGLVIIIFGGIGARAAGAETDALTAIVVAGFAILFFSVAVR